MSPDTSLKAQKAVLRKRNRTLRNQLNSEIRQARDSAMQACLVAMVSQLRPGVIAAYWPFDGEPDLLPALSRLQEKEITFALPLIEQSADSPHMTIRQWSPETRMANSQFGIPEPVGMAEISLPEIDIVLLPLVAWDEFGGRLGMGGGFYDRLLQPFSEKIKPLRVGVAYDMQRVPRLPLQPWDIHLHMVLSESGLLHTKYLSEHTKKRE